MLEHTHSPVLEHTHIPTLEHIHNPNTRTHTYLKARIYPKTHTTYLRRFNLSHVHSFDGTYTFNHHINIIILLFWIFFFNRQGKLDKRFK